MKILLVSDTHGRTDRLENLLKKYRDEVQLVCHMGDYGDDLTRFESAYPGLKMAAVRGNTDFACDAPTERVLELACGIRLLLTHGHRLGVKRGLDGLFSYARDAEADAVFFGHTHEELCFFESGLFFVNPGSLTFGRVRESTYAIVTVTNEGEIKGELLEYGE